MADEVNFVAEEAKCVKSGIPQHIVDDLKGFDWAQLVAILQLILKLLSGKVQEQMEAME